MFHLIKSLFRKPAPVVVARQTEGPTWKGEREVEALSIMYADWVGTQARLPAYPPGLHENAKKYVREIIEKMMAGKSICLPHLDTTGKLKELRLTIERGRVEMKAPGYHKVRTFDDTWNTKQANPQMAPWIADSVRSGTLACTYHS